jgi:hypothetical protein
MPGKESAHSPLVRPNTLPRSKIENELGRLQADYRGAKPGLWNALLLPASGLAVLVPLGYGLWRANVAYIQYGSVAANIWGRPWFVLSALASACFLMLAGYRLYLLRRHVAVYKNGLRLRLGLIRSQTFLWRELSGISSAIVQERFLHLPLRTTHQAALFPHQGKPVQIHGPLQEMPALIARLTASLYPRLLPDLREQFTSGKWLVFGSVAVQRQGIAFQSDRERSSSRLPALIPWDAVAEIDVQAGRLVIRLRDGHHRRIPVIKIPNLEIMLELVHQGVQQ